MRAPAAAPGRDSFMNPKTAFFYLVLILLPFSMMEGVFRLLPVSAPPYILPVTAQIGRAHV